MQQRCDSLEVCKITMTKISLNGEKFFKFRCTALDSRVTVLTATLTIMQLGAFLNFLPAP